MTEPESVERLLRGASESDEQAVAALFPLVYDQLKGLARVRIARLGKGQTLRTTELVHESFLRLVGGDSTWENRKHFFGAAARAMRNVLVDAARKRRRQVDEPGGPSGDLLDVVVTDPPLEDVLLVDEALTRLAAEHPRPAQVVNLRYFAGLSMPEVAEVVDVSLSTAERDWRFARTWLQRELWPDGS